MRYLKILKMIAEGAWSIFVLGLVVYVIIVALS